ncbi:energy-coupling factor ABC transporter ATP-binding protein [Devriesea agamarum]|uniref:energy-coupling factor ABC transporter ATP-binding protein n=1 Tax=Devriesea agamarum TaxID=472569 RepID=UPI000AC0B287|nr:ABC transporter ATP-binding protein [Devriesea agamarum]
MKIELDQVDAHYDSHQVLNGLSLTITDHTRLAVVGANGSGKSTLFKICTGMVQPTAGTVTLDGQSLTYSRPALRELRRRVQLVMQDPDDQLFSAEVFSDVSFGPINLGLSKDEVRRRVDEALELLQITHLARRPTHQLSYGERKRVTLAGAMAMRPDVLLLDEPSAGLDPEGVAEMFDALSVLEEYGTTLVLSTHEMELAWEWADRVAVIADGQATSGGIDLLVDPLVIRRSRLRVPILAQLAKELTPGRLPRTVAELLADVKTAAPVTGTRSSDMGTAATS